MRIAQALYEGIEIPVSYTHLITGERVEVINPGGVNRVSLEFSGSDLISPRLEGGALMIAEITILPEALR